MFAELYIWFKLVHVVLALTFFGLQGVYALRKNDLYQATNFASLRAAFSRFETLSKLARTNAMLILASGLFLVFTAWGWHTAWVNLAVGLFAFNIVSSLLIDQPWGKAMNKAVATGEGSLSPEVRALVHDPKMQISHTLKGAVDFALIFLMTVKPGLWLALGGSVLIIAGYTAFVLLQAAGKMQRRQGMGMAGEV